MSEHRATTDGLPPDPGLEDASAPKPVNPETGQHRAYWVLSEEERAKGFVRPLRHDYVHAGPQGPEHPLRDLTEEELERFREAGYAKFEAYPEGSSIVGRFWKQFDLDRIGRCGAKTTMSPAIAATYARDPKFYGATFCTACRGHFPVSEFRWDGTDEVVGS